MTSAFESREATRWRNFATEEPQVWGEPQRAKPLWAILASGRVRCVRAPGSPFGTESFQYSLVTVPLGDHDLNQEEHCPPCRQTDGLGELSDLCVLLKTPNIELAAKTHIRTNSLSLPPSHPSHAPPPTLFSSLPFTSFGLDLAVLPGDQPTGANVNGRECRESSREGRCVPRAFWKDLSGVLCPQNEVSVV